MRILHLPVNTASLPSISARAQRKLGHESRVLLLEESRYHDNDPSICVIIPRIRLRSKVVTLVNLVIRTAVLLRWLLWADVVHWYSTPCSLLPNKLDFRLIKFLRKNKVIEFLGSEVRDPKIESARNPFYRSVYESGDGYEYPYESAELSERNQILARRYGFKTIIASEGLVAYLREPAFAKATRGIDVDRFATHYPSVNGKTLVSHSPSAPVCKGTVFVKRAVDALRGQGFNVELTMALGTDKKNASDIVAGCDIFVDQLILGDLGMSTLEAMAMGKVVVCYILDEVRESLPEGLPVVNANPDTIQEVLESLIRDKGSLERIGRDSRRYVESYFSSSFRARCLLEAYRRAASVRAGRERAWH
jgi:hypothetical protein